MLNLKKTALALLISGSAFSAMAIPITTSIVTIMDESGSMGGEQAWSVGMITALDAELSAAAGVDAYNGEFGLVGFGGNYSYSRAIDANLTNPGFDEWGTAAQASAAATQFYASGGFEDGYDGMNTAFGYTPQADSVLNMILVTDEDRDIGNHSLNYNAMLSTINNSNALLNAVLSVTIRCADNSTALGIDSNGTGYVADGNGGFTTCQNATLYNSALVTDYGNLALASGGAVWDLNQLRSGGLTATSFSAAFVDVKVQETITIITAPIPEPLTTTIFASGLLGLGILQRRRRRNQ